MLDIIRKSAPEKIKVLVADTSLTDRERCAKLYAYLTQKIDDPKVRVQTEASVSSEGRHYHVILKDQTWRGPGRENQAPLRLIFTHTADGEVVES
jgi:hypothetical protein